MKHLFNMLPAPIHGGFKMEDYWVWCPSVIEGEDKRFHMFASRWSKKYPMHPGWLIASEIIRAVSDTPEGPYYFEEVVLSARGPQFWDGRSCHNPHIKKIGGLYILYYMGSTHPFPEMNYPKQLTLEDPRTIVARANKRIGIAVSKSIYGPWRRMDKPILMPRPAFFDNFFVSNPAPLVRRDGSVIMMYKSRYYKKDLHSAFLHGNMQLGIAISNRYDGDYKRLSDSPIFQCELEDPFLWEQGSLLRLIAKDMTGDICGEKGGGIYATSECGLKWEISKETIAYARNVLWDDGVVREMGNLERPFILFSNEIPTHLFFATSDGTNGQGFKNCRNTWNMVIPLKN